MPSGTNGSSSIPMNEKTDVEMIRYFSEERMILTLWANLGELGTESTSFRVPRAKYLIESALTTTLFSFLFLSYHSPKEFDFTFLRTFNRTIDQ